MTKFIKRIWRKTLWTKRGMKLQRNLNFWKIVRWYPPIYKHLIPRTPLNLVSYRTIPGLREAIFDWRRWSSQICLKSKTHMYFWEIASIMVKWWKSVGWRPLRKQPLWDIPWFLVTPRHIKIQQRIEKFSFYVSK